MAKIEGLISIARKAGFCIIGLDNLKNHKQKLYLLLVDAKAGNSLLREMRHMASMREIPLMEVDNLENCVMIENCKAVGIKNKAMSDSVLRCIKGED